MYIMKSSKEFATLGLTVEEVIKGLNKYFDGPSIDNVRFHSAEIDYTYCYSPKCCLSAAILWLHEKGGDYFCGMSLPCEEEKKASSVKARTVLNADIKIEPDAPPELTVKMALWDGTFDNVLIDSICDDLIRYISRYGEERDDMVPLHDAEDELLNLKRRIISALGVSLSDRMIRLEDASEPHDFSYPITLIAHQTKSHENVCRLLKKTDKKCTELENRVEKAEDEQKELTDTYNNLRNDLIDVLGIDRDSNDPQLLCKVSRLYYFRREVQRKLDCLDYSDADTIPVLRRVIDKAKLFDDLDRQYMETTKSLCEIAAIIERLQK